MRISSRIASMIRLVGIVVLSGACSAPAATVAPIVVTPAPTGAVTTPPATTPQPRPTTSASSPNAQRLPVVRGAPKPLEAGTYLTPETFQPAVAITVPDGWYGGAGRGEFSVGQGLDRVAQRYADAGLFLGVINLEYDAAVEAFGALHDVEFTEPSSATTVDGHEATVFHANPIGDRVVINEIAPGADLTPGADRQIFVEVDGQTVLIRTELFASGTAAALQEVVDSIRFP